MDTNFDKISIINEDLNSYTISGFGNEVIIYQTVSGRLQERIKIKNLDSDGVITLIDAFNDFKDGIAQNIFIN